MAKIGSLKLSTESIQPTVYLPELQVRSLCSRSPQTPGPNTDSSNQAKLNCDPCQFEIAVISDNDEKSKSNTTENQWESTFGKASLEVKASGKSFTITLGDLKHTVILNSSINADGKGMELSELIYFNGRLLTFDDKTGTVFYITNDKVHVWIKLSDCPGNDREGFKSEWATIKDEKLYVGSAGFPWTPSSANDSEPTNCGPQWIKVVDEQGKVENVNWKPMFHKLQKGTKCKGYITHEGVTWSAIRKRWYFAPRKCSAEAFDSKTDGQKGSNLLISVDENFENIQVVEVGEFVATRGFSTFKFLPHSEDTIIIALKTYEDKDHTFHTYLTVFGIDGEVFLPDKLLSGEQKFEGVEFLQD